MEKEYLVLNIDNIIKQKDIPNVIKGAALDLKYHTYLSIGDFLKKISDEDLEILSDYCDNIFENKYHPEEVSNIALLATILLTGEGLEANEETVAEAIDATIMFITLEGLARKDLVEVYRENFTLDPIYKELIVAKRKED